MVLDNRPISLGYNGAPAGEEHCGSDCNSHSPCKNTIHAEDNAIRWAKRFLDNPHLEETTLYITDSPCVDCAMIISKAGIKRVVYDRKYRITDGIDLLESHGVEVTQCHARLAISAN